MICEICGASKTQRNNDIQDFMSLARHVRMLHKTTSQEYYDKFLKKENEGKCLICNKETLYVDMRRGYCFTCSVSCSNVIMMRNDEIKNRMIQTNRVSQIKRWSDHEKRRIQSIKVTEYTIKNPDNKNKFYSSGYYFSKKNNCEIYYASSYEKRAFEILELLNEVKYFNRCKFSVDYLSPNDSRVHKYIPDIEIVYTSGKRQILEIKPVRLLDDVVMAKSAAAKEQFGDSFIVWTEKQLFA